MEFLVLLLKGFHSALEKDFQPLAATNGEELHSIRHLATFICSADDVSKGVIFASTEISFPTGSTIVVGNVTGTESELADAVVDGCLLKG